MSEQYVIFTIGLQGSGKTTWANDFCYSISCPGEPTLEVSGVRIEGPLRFVRLEKDIIRENLYGLEFKWSPKKEQKVAVSQREIIMYHLDRGNSLILSDTNLDKEKLQSMKEYVLSIKPDIIILEKSFRDVPLETCIERDKLRAKPVGEEVIRKAARKYFLDRKPFVRASYNPDLPDCIICDLDGTLCEIDLTKRTPYESSKCYEDTPNTAITRILSAFHFNIYYSPRIKIFFFSGRYETSRSETFNWLVGKSGLRIWETGVPLNLHMRSMWDDRDDVDVKLDMYNEHIKDKYNVLFAFDDRPRIIRLWKSLGIDVFAVGDGEEF